jgi:hypothetical protein
MVQKHNVLDGRWVQLQSRAALLVKYKFHIALAWRLHDGLGCLWKKYHSLPWNDLLAVHVMLTIYIMSMSLEARSRHRDSYNNDIHKLSRQQVRANQMTNIGLKLSKLNHSNLMPIPSKSYSISSLTTTNGNLPFQDIPLCGHRS